jgi:hypothetical protein
MYKKIFDLNDDEISKLAKGDFAIPNLNWNSEITLLIGGSDSIKGMATNMERNGYENQIRNLKNEIGSDLDAEIISKKIKDEINEFENNSKDNIIDIFHLIQLWGGRSARQFYLKKCQINKIFYTDFVEVITKTDDIQKIILATEKLVIATSQFNVSFITKHVSFWQKYSKNSRIKLPIYDNIIALNIMGRFNTVKGKLIGHTYNDFKFLEKYWIGMVEVSKELNVPINNIERQIFNFFRSGTSKSWPRNFKK